MTTTDRPKLRPISAVLTVQNGARCVALVDPFGVVAEPVVLPVGGFEQVVRYFDGAHSLGEIQLGVLQRTGQWLNMDELTGLVAQLEQRMVLEGPTFDAFLGEYRAAGIRRPAMAGRSYPSSEKALRAVLDRCFHDPAGSGPPDEDAAPDGRLRAVMSPHIDFGRGGPTYTHAYRALVEQSEADVFVILGVAHRPCQRRFAMTYKDFETPLGLVRTDRTFVERVAAIAGESVFDDEIAHLNEHSVEFQVLFLQHLLGGRRDFSIVPILTGSFDDLMQAGVDPIDDPEVRCFLEGLKAAEGASAGKVLYIGGVDFGHIGREFGDPDLIDDGTLGALRQFDESMIGAAAAVEPSSWFRTAAAVKNRWRVCGLAATYTMLHAIGPAEGALLRYDQAVNPDRTCCVSFASMAFHRSDDSR